MKQINWVITNNIQLYQHLSENKLEYSFRITNLQFDDSYGKEGCVATGWGKDKFGKYEFI